MWPAQDDEITSPSNWANMPTRSLFHLLNSAKASVRDASTFFTFYKIFGSLKAAIWHCRDAGIRMDYDDLESSKEYQDEALQRASRVPVAPAPY